MASVVKTNGITKEIDFGKSLLMEVNGVHVGTKITVQQALCKWYSLFIEGTRLNKEDNLLFAEIKQENLLRSLQTDIELIPPVLMNEFISTSLIFDKEQYIRLVQALLINLSDCLYLEKDEFSSVCSQIENTLQFIQDFFYHQFDADSRLTKFYFHQFCGSSKLKLEYWKIKLHDPTLIGLLEECLADKFSVPENDITYSKINYIKYLLQEIELATNVIAESYVRALFTYNNFNSVCFANYEIQLIQTGVAKLQTYQETISFLQLEQRKIAQQKIKSGIAYDNRQPSLKRQLSDWITEEIRQVELKNKKAGSKDLPLYTESKIQTSLSVAKLAVLIRLMVVDKIIINKSVAPMLRTVTKLFTTLQKEEISFGSLETKYHAPDKNIITNVKDMLSKWLKLIDKL